MSLTREDDYSKLVVLRNCPRPEDALAKGAQWTYWYARYIIQDRWPLAEEIIWTNAEYAYYYARDVIHKRFLRGEPTIVKEAEFACAYARDILKNRWLEAEEIIAQSVYRGEYIGSFFPKQEIITKDEVEDFLWLRSEANGYFAPKEMFKEKSLSLLDIGVQL